MADATSRTSARRNRGRPPVQSPLRRAMLTTGKTVGSIARRLKVSEVTVNRWLDGARKAPPDLYILLGLPPLERAHNDWCERRRRGAVHEFRFVDELPAEVDPIEAAERCREVVAGLVAARCK